MNIVININIRGFNYLILLFCVIIMLMFNIMIIKIMILMILNFLLYVDLFLDFGIFLSNIKVIIEKMIDNMKIYCYLINVVIILVNRDVNFVLL